MIPNFLWEKLDHKLLGNFGGVDKNKINQEPKPGFIAHVPKLHNFLQFLQLIDFSFFMYYFFFDGYRSSLGEDNIVVGETEF